MQGKSLFMENTVASKSVIWESCTMARNIKKNLIAHLSPVRHILDGVGSKWSMLVIVLLEKSGKIRFKDIGKQIGDISQKMLTSTLRSLEADDLVSREVYAEVPPWVEYELTDLVMNSLPHICQLSP